MPRLKEVTAERPSQPEMSANTAFQQPVRSGAEAV
jgi:hypothetical protein